MAEIKDMIKFFRKREGWTQEELAKKVGVGKSAISMYEKGERMPNYEVEEALADVFNVSLDVLRGLDNEYRGINSPEIREYLEVLQSRPEMRMLFSVTKDAPKKDIEQTVKIIQALRGNENVDT